MGKTWGGFELDGGIMVHVPGVNLVRDSVALYGRKKTGVGLLILKPTDG